MQYTIGDMLSRIRKKVKAITQDAFLTDRYLYSLIIKHGNWLMKREDGANKLLKFDSIVQPIGFVELIEVDRVEAQCQGISTDCLIKRSKDKLPSLFEGYNGVLIRSVTSLDGSQELQRTDPTTYVKITRQTNFKYNKTKYYWFLDGYLYFPALEWDGVRVEGIWEEDVSNYGCPTCLNCQPRQKDPLNIPGYLHGELEKHVDGDIREMMGIPPDTAPDKQAPTR